MKKDFFDVIGHEYINRNSGEKCLVVNVDNDSIVHYRRYSNLDRVHTVNYKGFRCSWKNAGPHKPFIGRLYKARANGNYWHEKAVFITGYRDDVNVQFDILNSDRSAYCMHITIFKNIFTFMN